MNRVTLFSICASAGFLLYILEMVRRRKLREEYSILWLFGSALILVLSLKQEWLIVLAHAAGVVYPPSFLFLIGILFILLILIHFSIAISKLHQMNKKISQEMSLLKHRLEEKAPEQERPWTRKSPAGDTDCGPPHRPDAISPDK